MNLGEVAVGSKHQDALRRLAEWKRFLAVGRDHLGHDEIPGPDNLIAQIFLLRPGLAARERDSSTANMRMLFTSSPLAVFRIAIQQLD